MVVWVRPLGLVLPVFVATGLGACGGSPGPTATAPVPATPSAAQPQKRVALPGDCDQQPGKPPPDPLERSYTGVAAKARCQREVYTIMGGVTHFLGVECKYCHLVPNYRAMTHRKEIANWMAADLIPSLQKKGGGQVWCNNCHSAGDKGVARILGEPRKQSFAIEWMTTHLVEDFETKKGSPLHCKSCHQGNLGTPEFRRKIILTNNLPAD
jgi:hypothetical protein